MGTPVHEIVPGAECLKWNPPAGTPETMYCIFWDILKGTAPGAVVAPNGHVFKMDQEVGIPCQWVSHNALFGWQTRLGIDAAETWLHLRGTGPRERFYFAHTKPVSPPAEYELFTNLYQQPINTWGYEGYGTIFWLERVLWLVEQFGWEDLTDLMLESFPIDAVNIVHRFASRAQRTNTKIKLTP